MSKSDVDANGSPTLLLADLVARHARHAPAKTAIVCGDALWTYGRLDTWADWVAAALQRDGATPGGVAAVCAPSSARYLAIILGVLRAGLAVAPLSPSATPEQLAAMVADSGANHLFLHQTTGAALAGAPVRVRRVSLDGSSAGEPLAQWLAPEGVEPGPVVVSPETAFNVIYSSGTTGAPKGIVHSHRMRAGLYGAAEAMGFTTDAVTLVSTPLYSNTTLTAVLPTLAVGGTLVLMEKFDAGAFLELAERTRATHAMLVPVQYRRLLEHPEFDARDLSSFRVKYATSAPFSAELKAEVLRRWPGGLVEFFGLTEGGGSTMLQAHAHPDKLHTVGPAAPGHEIRIVDDNGRELAAGETGEIVGRSPSVMTGYHNRPDETAATRWTSSDGEVFLRTGDVGRLDEDGFLTILDRRKDMIISGGFNIYPSDLEAVLASHPDVREAAVVGVPSVAWGETPVGFVVLAHGAQTTAATLQAWMGERVGRTQRLSDLRLVAELPRSAIGKVLKRDLRAGYMPSAAQLVSFKP